MKYVGLYREGLGGKDPGLSVGLIRPYSCPGSGFVVMLIVGDIKWRLRWRKGISPHFLYSKERRPVA